MPTTPGDTNNFLQGLGINPAPTQGSAQTAGQDFSSFLDKQQTQKQLQTTGQLLQQKGLWGDTGAKIFDSLTGGLQRVGQDIGQGIMAKTNKQTIQGYATNAATLADLAAKQTDPVLKQKYTDMATSTLKDGQQAGLDLQGRTPEQIVGDVLEAGVESAGAISGGLGIADLAGAGIGATAEEVAAQAAKTTGQKVLEGGLTGAKIGGGFGAAQGVSTGLENKGNVQQVVTQGLEEGGVGAAGGAVVGASVPAAIAGFGKISDTIGGITDSYQQRQALLGAAEDSGVKPELPQTVQDNPTLAPIVKEAQNQGMSDKDINFLATASPEDKPTMLKMLNLAEQAQSDNRVIERPMDVVGDNGTKLLATVQEANSSAGEQLNQIADGLKGQTVDTTQMHNDAMDMLEKKFGITESVDEKTGEPVLDFSNSIFKKTPALQNQLSTALSDLPGNETDAADLHTFKQSLYNLIDYGKQTGDTSGQSQYILKNIAHLADGTLDSNFSDYASANADYAKTKGILDTAQGMIGKNTDFTTDAGKQSFGQSLRSAFSNNKSRGSVLQFISDLQDTANEYGANSKQNLLDQALFSQILEENFGSPATTGLSGEVEKAIDNAKGLVKFANHPISETAGYLAKGAMKLQGQSPEMKIAILKALLK